MMLPAVAVVVQQLPRAAMQQRCRLQYCCNSRGGDAVQHVVLPTVAVMVQQLPHAAAPTISLQPSSNDEATGTTQQAHPRLSGKLPSFVPPRWDTFHYFLYTPQTFGGGVMQTGAWKVPQRMTCCGPQHAAAAASRCHGQQHVEALWHNH